MGIIARQSFKAGIVSYSSVLIGILNQILIFPLCLTVDEYGAIQFILQTSVFFTPFILFGMTTVLTRYYPKYNDSPTNKSLLFGVAITPIFLNTLIFLVLFVLFGDIVEDKFSTRSKITSMSILVLFVIATLQPWQVLSANIAAIKGRIAIPSLLSHSIKLFLPVIAALYFFDMFTYDQVILSLLAYHVCITIGHLIYVSRIEFIRPKFSLKNFKTSLDIRSITSFALFSMFTGVGVNLTNQIDNVMVTSIQGTYENGLYSWSLFCATAIAIPYTLVAAISTPIISKLWKNRDLNKLDLLYKSSSSTLLVLSILLFTSFWLVIDDLFALMPKGEEFMQAKNLVALLCISKILDLATGLNSHILSMSKSYKKLLWYLGLAAIINVGLNWILIARIGLVGCGIATLVSISFFNYMKYTHLKRLYKLTPFTIDSVKIIVLAFVVYGIVFLLPKTGKHFANLFIYSGSFALLFSFSIYRFKLSPDINLFIDRSYNSVQQHIKKILR